MTFTNLVLTRIGALMLKESRQLLRDRATFGMLLGIPILQIALFGCAIELAPHSLQICVMATDQERFVRVQRLLAPYEGSVRISRTTSHSAAMAALKRGSALMVVDADSRPPIVYLDATDPVLETQAESMIGGVVRSVSGPVEDDAATPLLYVHRLYNPGLRTQPFMVS